MTHTITKTKTKTGSACIFTGCGYSNTNPSATGRIVGGQEVNPMHSKPYQVMMVRMKWMDSVKKFLTPSITLLSDSCIVTLLLACYIAGFPGLPPVMLHRHTALLQRYIIVPL